MLYNLNNIMTPSSSSSPLPLSYISLFRIYTIVAIYRLINAYFIQTQFDPDEYWQTLEPAYCLAFHSSRNCVYTWEWTRSRSLSRSQHQTNMFIETLQNVLHGPVRSHVSILPTFWFYKIIHFLSWDSTYMMSHGPLYIHALFVVAPTDVATYVISRWIHNIVMNNPQKNCDNPNIPLLALMANVTNWFHGYALIRTYSNSVETMLLIVGMALLSPELFGRYELQIQHQQRNYSYRRNAKIAFVLGGLSVAIRFTSLAAWIPIGLILSFRDMYIGSRKESNENAFRNGLYTVLNLCALYGGMGLLIACMIDWYFYDKIVIPFLGNIHFNVILGNGSLYGTHPSYWYFIAGLPAIAGVLLPFFLYESYIIIFKGKKNSEEESQVHDNCVLSSERILLTIIISYVTFHSISSHKEFRFILPILPLLCILSSCAMQRYITSNHNTNNKIQKRRMFNLGLLLFLMNYPHMIYLAIFHQRSPISVNQSITSTIQNMLNSRNDDDYNQIHEKETFHIHYLMGCHSTPLYSHLHLPQQQAQQQIPKIDTWTLDCSPECRRRLDSSCESDVFITNPYEFIMDAYSLFDLPHPSMSKSDISKHGPVFANSLKEAVLKASQLSAQSSEKQGHVISSSHEEVCISNGDESCRSIITKEKRDIPDFLAIFDNELESNHVRDLIENKMDMIEIGKFVHGIREIEWKHQAVSFQYMYLFGKGENHPDRDNV